MNLSHKQLIGEILEEIEKMRSLESLDHQLNNLSGRTTTSLRIFIEHLKCKPLWYQLQ